MAKLTEKQANILRQALSGSIIMHLHRIGMYSDSWHFEGGEHIDGRSALGLHTRGLIRPHIDRDPSGIDYPYMISDAGREALAAYDAKHAQAESADAAQTAAAGDAVTVASIQAALDAIEWTDADSGSGIFAKVEQLSDGIGCEWFFKDTGRFLDFEGLGKTPEDAMRKVKTMIDTDDRKVDPRDAQIAALERELEAVKQMFDGYQAAARETEQAAQRDLEAARTEAAALREALAEMPKYRLGQEVSVGEYSPAIGKVEEIRITDDGIDYSVYVEGESMAYTWSEGKVSPADPDAALAAARQTDA